MFIKELPTIDVNKEEMAQYVIKKYDKLREKREVWMTRRRKYLANYDEYIISSKNRVYESFANVRVPLTEWLVQAVHSYLLYACNGLPTPFNTRPRESTDRKLVENVDFLMKWVLDEFINYGFGIDDVLDEWLYNTVVDGDGIAHLDWEIIERYTSRIDLEKFSEVLKGGDKGDVEALKEDIYTVCDCPVLEAVPAEDIVYPARNRFSYYMDCYSLIARRRSYTEAELKQKVKDGAFDEKIVDEILERSEEDWDQKDRETEFKKRQDYNVGIDTVNVASKYHFVQAFFEYKLANGNVSKLVSTIHVKSKKAPGLTYLDLVNPSGNVPFYKMEFHRRPKRTQSRGLVETVHSCQKEADLMHNMSLDFGIINAMPFGTYKPYAGKSQDSIALKPGILIPSQDPTSDLSFPYRPQTQAWPAQQEQLSIGYAEKLSFTNDLMFGQMPSPVGGARSTSGMRQMLAQVGVNYDKLLKRILRPYGRMLHDLYAMLQIRMPDETEVRLGMEEGIPKTGKMSRSDLGGKMDFKMTANAQNTNRELDAANAQTDISTLMNRYNIENGLVTPIEAYNMQYDYLIKKGDVDPDRKIRKPETGEQPLSIHDELKHIIQGRMPRIVMADKLHKQKIEAVDEYMQSEQFKGLAANGMVSPLARTIAEQIKEAHAGALDVLQQMEQRQNYQGEQAPNQAQGGRYGGIGKTTT